MARRGDHSKEELKKLIFINAKKIVEKNGYKDLSARKLATKIGYTPGTIYSFYKNFDELVLYINSDTLDRIYDELFKITEKTKKPENALKEMTKAYVSFGFQNQNFWDLLFNYQYNEPEEIEEWYLRKVERNFALAEKVISELVCNKSDIKDLAKVFWAGIQGISGLSLRGKLDIAKSKSSEHLALLSTTNFIKGLKN